LRVATTAAKNQAVNDDGRETQKEKLARAMTGEANLGLGFSIFVIIATVVVLVGCCSVLFA
jgi:hypothetical protein